MRIHVMAVRLLILAKANLIGLNLDEILVILGLI